MVDITAQHMVPTVREFSEVRESQGKWRESTKSRGILKNTTLQKSKIYSKIIKRATLLQLLR